MSTPTLSPETISPGRTTHVIVLTAPGRAALAVVRVEGPRALELTDRCFQPVRATSLAASAVGAIRFGHWRGSSGSDAENATLTKSAGEELVIARVADDAVEITCHGGPISVQVIVDDLVASGAVALPWEHWVRLHAKSPITADAQIALARAETTATVAVLADQYSGALENELRRIIDLLDAASHDETTKMDAIARLQRLLQRAALGLHLLEPWQIVLAGVPNVGKSSLMNRLVGFQRAIVHETPGTTRDLVTFRSAVEGWPVELCDTAGQRSIGQRNSNERVEQAGIALAQDRADRADLVVLVCDASRSWTDHDQQLRERWPRSLVVLNKCDLPEGIDPRCPAGLRVSAATGERIGALLEAIAARLVPDPPQPGEAIPFTLAQIDAITTALDRLRTGQIAEARRTLETMLAH